MTRLAEIEAHIAGMSELLDIVRAMRSLAGMRMQEAQHVLPGIRLYAQSVAAGLADLLPFMEAPQALRNRRERFALVLCTAEHGFVGGFNERLNAAAKKALSSDDLLFILGSRGAILALEQGLSATWTHPLPSRCANAGDALQRLSTELYRHISQGEIARVEIIYARYAHGGSVPIERRVVLPLDPASLKAIERRQPPLLNLAPTALHERLMGEYVFALLTEAAVESIAAENAARLAAMESAHANMSKKLEQLRQSALQFRQAEITAELTELVTGSRAIVDGAS